MNFENPLLLFLLAPWAVLVWFLTWRMNRSANALSLAISPRFLPRVTLLTRPAHRVLYGFWLFFGGSLILAAVAGPVAISRGSVRGESVRPILFVLDGSLSMMAEDTVPVFPGKGPDGVSGLPIKGKNRMDLAAKVALVVADAFPKSSVALASYSGLAVSHSPFTHDHGALRQVLSKFEDHWYQQTGTDFRSGLDLVLRQQGRRGGEHMQVLWISDGEEEHGRGFEDEARTLSRMGIPIHTVAVGSAKGTKIWVKRPEDMLANKSKARTETFKTRKETSALKKLADLTGGSFFDLEEKPDLTPVVKALGKSTYSARMGSTASPTDMSWVFLIAFTFWWLLDLFVLDAWPLWKRRRHRPAGGLP